MTGNKGNFEAATPGQIKDILEGVDLIADPSDPSLGAWRVKLNEITAPSDVAEHFPRPLRPPTGSWTLCIFFAPLRTRPANLREKGKTRWHTLLSGEWSGLAIA